MSSLSKDKQLARSHINLLLLKHSFLSLLFTFCYCCAASAAAAAAGGGVGGGVGGGGCDMILLPHVFRFLSGFRLTSSKIEAIEDLVLSELIFHGAFNKVISSCSCSFS